MENYFNVISEPSYSEESSEIDSILLKISTIFFEINIHIPQNNLPQIINLLANISPKAISAGTCAESVAHWIHEEGDESYILIGHDRETWDIGVTLNKASTLRIINEFKKY